MVILQESAETLTSHNAIAAARLSRCRRDQPIAQALMVAFVMIVLGEFRDGSPERPFTDENQPVKAGFVNQVG